MQKKMLRISISTVLILSMIFGMAFIGGPGKGVGTAVSAQEIAASGGTAGLDSSQMSFSATNTFGTLLASEVQGAAEQQEANGGCNIFSVEVSGTTAVLELETLYDAEAVVGIYDEDGVKMLASGHCAVSSEDTSATVYIEADSMPEYFLVRAFLIEPESLRPLCTVHESPMYTKDMQEILNAKASDYEEERVLNLDDDDETNFAVLKEDTVVIPKSERNRVTTADDENGLYIIEDADESITSLQVGDTFTYMYDDENIIIVKISSIEVSGTTVTIRGEDISLDDAFEVVKVEGESGMENCEVDNSGLEEGVEYNGIADAREYEEQHPETVPGQTPDYTDNIPETSVSYGFIDKEIKGGAGEGEAGVSGSIKLNGDVLLNFKGDIKYYLSGSEKFVNVNIDYSVIGTLTMTGKAAANIPLGYIAFSPGCGLYISFTPYLIVEVSGSLTIAFKLTGSIGVNVTGNGIKNASKSPRLSAEIKAEVTVYIGLSIVPKITIIDDDLAKIELNATVGAKARAVYDKYKTPDTDQPDVKHLCENCIAGEVFLKSDIKVMARLLDMDELTFKRTFKVLDEKIADFYYSFDYNEFAFTTCPHKQYRISVYALDENGKAAPGATVQVSGQTLTADDKGVAEVYLPAGKYTAIVVYSGGSGSKTFRVKKAANVKIKTGAALKNPASISSGLFHNAAVTNDGSLYLWGYNCYGQIGDGTAADKKTPVKIMDNVASVTLEYYSSAAITKDGKLYMWGDNEYGQLGDGTTEERHTPVQILKNVASVTLGSDHSAAVTKDGSLYMWGSNYVGQIGNGTATNSWLPAVPPVKIMDNVASVSLGREHSAALTKDGSLYMWGSNSVGQLGDGTREDRYSPVKIMDNVASVSVGDLHSAAVTKDGDLYVWGSDEDYQVGDGEWSAAGRTEPIKILSAVASVKLGNRYSSAITTDGGLYFWGGSPWGYEDTVDYYTTPVKLLDNIASAAFGGGHCAAITKGGDLYLWGDNVWGYIGDGTTENRHTPVKIMSNVASVDLGTIHSVALTKDGSLYTWGNNINGQLGDGTTEHRHSPTLIAKSDSGTQKLSALEAAPVQTAGNGKKAAFSDLVPGEIYNYYLMSDRDADDPLSDENLLYIAQCAADENGRLSIDYAPKREDSGAEGFVVGMGLNTASGSSVTGKITSFGDASEPVTVELLSGDDVIASTTVTGGSAEYSFDDVPAGEYTIRVSKKDHATAEYQISVDDGGASQDIAMSMSGDINGDNKINSKDIVRLMKCLAGEDVEINAAAVDFNGDGKVNSKDLVRLMKYIAGADLAS